VARNVSLARFLALDDEMRLAPGRVHFINPHPWFAAAWAVMPLLRARLAERDAEIERLRKSLDEWVAADPEWGRRLVPEQEKRKGV
jgi:hypothetical protein